MICWGGISRGAIYSRAQAECLFTQEAESAQRRHETQLQNTPSCFLLQVDSSFLTFPLCHDKDNNHLPFEITIIYLFDFLAQTCPSRMTFRDGMKRHFCCAAEHWRRWRRRRARSLSLSHHLRLGRRHYDPDVT